MDRTGRSWRPPPLVSSDWEPSRRHRNGGAPGGARDFMFTAPWLVNFPGLPIFLTVLGFNRMNGGGRGF
jgi:hypothetical protein